MAGTASGRAAGSKASRTSWVGCVPKVPLPPHLVEYVELLVGHLLPGKVGPLRRHEPSHILEKPARPGVIVTRKFVRTLLGNTGGAGIVSGIAGLTCTWALAASDIPGTWLKKELHANNEKAGMTNGVDRIACDSGTKRCTPLAPVPGLSQKAVVEQCYLSSSSPERPGPSPEASCP